MKKIFTTLILVSSFLFLISNPVSATPQVGAYFFYWYDCPDNNCQVSRMSNPPVNISGYSANKLDWYKSEFKDMEAAGLDMLIPVSWGSGHPGFTWFHDNKDVPLMVQALEENKSTLKIAYFDDTNSEVAEWNVDQGKGYTNPSENPAIPKMPLNDTKNWGYFYDRKLKPFYQAIPTKYWATHNGLRVEQGGRPIILIYDASRSFTNLEQAPKLWTTIKNNFKADFNNVEPFIVLDYSWFVDPNALTPVIDGKFIWAGENDTVERQYNINNYTISTIDPGSSCSPLSQYTVCDPKHRNQTFPDKVNGPEDARLKSMWTKYSSNSNLILVETWNELWEATTIARSNDYPKNGGGNLPSDFYIQSLRQLIGKPIISSSIPGDTNNDKRVDLIDFTAWKQEYTGKLTTKKADSNGDSKVDLLDFVTWKKAYLQK